MAPCTYEDFGAAEAKMRRDLSDRTVWLCTVMRLLDSEAHKGHKHLTTAYEVWEELPGSLKEWWQEHKLKDEERAEEEMRRAMTHRGETMEEVP